MANRYRTIKCVDGSEEWHELRKSGIGGSEVSTIMGLNKYETPYELWLLKTNRAKATDLSGNQAVEWGHRLEPLVAQKFADAHPELKVKNRNATFVDREHLWRHANIDRQVTEPDGTKAVLEIKTVGTYRAKDWYDGVPPYYLTQVTMYCLVTGWKRAYVAALVGGQDYREYVVEPDEADLEAVAKAVDGFWLDYVQADVPPALVGTESESRALLQQFPICGQDYIDGTQEEDAELSEYEANMASIRELKDEIAKLEDDNRLITNRLKERIGEHQGLFTPCYQVKWARGTRTSLDSKALKKAEPKLWAKYATDTPTQRLTIKNISSTNTGL